MFSPRAQRSMKLHLLMVSFNIIRENGWLQLRYIFSIRTNRERKKKISTKIQQTLWLMSFIAYDYTKSLHPPERTEQIFSYSFFSYSRLSHFNFNRHSIWTTLHDVTMMFSNLYQKYRSGCLSGWYMCIIYVYMSYFSTNKVLEKKKKYVEKYTKS